MNQLQEAIEYKASLWTGFHCICHCDKWINLSNHCFLYIPKNRHHETWITAFWDIEGCFLTNNKLANCLALPFILSNYFCSIWWQAKCLLFVSKKQCALLIPQLPTFCVVREDGLPNQVQLCGLGNIMTTFAKIFFCHFTVKPSRDKNSGKDSIKWMFFIVLQDCWDSRISVPLLE